VAPSDSFGFHAPTRDVFEDNTVEAKARSLRGQGQGQGQGSSRPRPRPRPENKNLKLGFFRFSKT